MTPKNSQWLVPGILITLYALIRTQGLTALPIFSDEAIYIHWAQIIHSQPEELLISKVGGRQPFFFWLNAVTLQFFSDPLLAGRWVSLVAGAFSVCGIFLIGRTLFSTTSGFLAGLFAIFCPYLFFFERLALVEGLLSALAIWAFLFALYLALELKTFKVGFRWLGILLGLALLTKATALMLFPVMLAVLFLWGVHPRPEFWKHLGTAGFIIAVINLMPFLGGPKIISPIGVSFLHPPEKFFSWAELMYFPKQVWGDNAGLVFDFLISYLTLPVILILLVGIIFFIRQRDKKELALWFWFLIPTGAMILVANGIFSRYMVMVVPPLLLLTARTLERLLGGLGNVMASRLNGKVQGAKLNGLLAILIIVTLFPSAMFDWKLVREPRAAPLNELDRFLYIEGANSGYGVREAADFLKQEARAFQGKTGYAMPLLVAASRGNPVEGVVVYLWREPTILKVPAYWWPRKEDLIPKENRFSLRRSIYQSLHKLRREAHLLDHARFIYPHTTIPQEKFLQDNPKFKKVWSYIKPDSKYSIDIFKNHQEMKDRGY